MRTDGSQGIVLGVALWSLTAAPLAALQTTTVERTEVVLEQVLDGVVEPVHQATVAAEMMGRVQAVNFDVDDVVPKGSVLIRFRDTEQRARLAQEKAAREEAKARLNEVQLEFNRANNLYAKKLVAKSDLDRAEAALESAKARVKAAQAGVQAAQEQFDRTVIKAPYSGIVVARHVEVGETTQVGQALMTGLSLETLRVNVQVPQSLIDTVRLRQRARVRWPDGRAVDVEGLTVFPYADERSHSFRVRLALPENTKNVYPGTFVKVAFDAGVAQRVLVPHAAVAHRSEVTAVYVVGEEGRVSMRQVRLGRSHGERIEILSGLSPGEQVALDPVQAVGELKQQWVSRHE